jgi:enoyl-CoA hydratase/carnithine racemase
MILAIQRQAMAAAIGQGEEAMTETADNSKAARKDEPWGDTVLVDFEDGIAWVTMNRPDKRNAMNPAMNREMNEVLDALEVDDRCGVLVLTGAGSSFSAGMDLKEYFRETDDKPRIVQVRAAAQSHTGAVAGDLAIARTILSHAGVAVVDGHVAPLHSWRVQ